MQSPVNGNSWLGLTDQVLPVGAAYEWCVQPNCGAVVLFSGTVRDHAVDEGLVRPQARAVARFHPTIDAALDDLAARADA